MWLRALSLALVAVLSTALLIVAATATAATVEFAPCPDHFGFSCATLPVPLDRSGQVPGTIGLKVERKSAGIVQTRDALIALSGGPGQAAIPSAEDIVKSMAPALTTRDLIVFDQRGTGQSDQLNCPALGNEQLGTATGSVAQIFEQCAQQIGPARGDFTTQESVADIEALRESMGYEKLVLRGVSYGTKVALEYAERYPEHVEALVLDSVVPSDGPTPFYLSTFQAIRPVISELCSAGACKHISPSPLQDLQQLAAQLHKHSLSGSVFTGTGHRVTIHLTELELLRILEAGDLNPALRSLLPGAVRSALRHDPEPLLRLDLLASGLTPTRPGPVVPPPEDSEEGNALYWATTCEELPFPWGRSEPASARMLQATAALNTLPSADFYPFDRETALAHSLLPECVGWPDAAPPPPAARPLPDVPTLIFSGGQDLRTPTSNARSVAAQIPGAQLLTVPYTGHSVLGSDFSGCAQAAVSTFFAGTPLQPCKTAPDLFAPTPLDPTSLSYLHPIPGVGGLGGRTLTAALDTIVDFNRQEIGATLEANQALPSGTSFGGLRGGYAKLGATTVRFSHFAFVNGLRISGSLPRHSVTLKGTAIRIEGSAGADGSIRIGSGGRVTGTLGGRRFSVHADKAMLAHAGAYEEASPSDSEGAWPSDVANPWPTRAAQFPYPALASTR